jgi:protein TonB
VLPEFSGGNIVAFARTRPQVASGPIPVISVDAQWRAAPLFPQRDRRHLPLIFAASLLVHGGFFIALDHAADPLPSTSLQEISVEIILESELAVAPPPEETVPPEETRPQVQPEPPPAAVEEPPPPLPEDRAETLQPPEEPPAAEDTPPMPEPRIEPPPPPRVINREPDRKPVPPVQRRAKPAPPRDTASAPSRARSVSDPNYQGLVAAQLARQKRYPADARARGEQGTALVSFSIDGSGRVTRVAIARGSGSSSLDQEVRAMVSRAAPFPPPPGGRGMSFTVPVSFRIQ